MAPELRDLPPEIVAVSAEVLDASHPPSLVAFAQTSKNHYAIAGRFLFRTVRITLGDYETAERLRSELARWEAMLIRSDAYSRVRRLIFYWVDFERDMLDNPYLALDRMNETTTPRTCAASGISTTAGGV